VRLVEDVRVLVKKDVREGDLNSGESGQNRVN